MTIPNPSDEPTMSIEAAGRCLGLGRASAYEAARRGDIPTISFGRRLRVPTARLRELVGMTAEQGGPTTIRDTMARG